MEEQTPEVQALARGRLWKPLSSQCSIICREPRIALCPRPETHFEGPERVPHTSTGVRKRAGDIPVNGQGHLVHCPAWACGVRREGRNLTE